METKDTFYARTRKAWRSWLQKNAASEKSVWLIIYKKDAATKSINYVEAVEEALCFGWIDGVRTSIDNNRYKIRFSRRKSTSIWSAINIQKIKDLTKQGLMMPAGIASFQNRKEDKSKIYSYENEEVTFSPDL